METEGPQHEEGTPRRSNVVRFPRDWLGPREELVQLGVDPADDGFSAQSADVVDLVPTPPPGAAEFWEGAAIHDALPGPVADTAEHALPADAAERRFRVRSLPFVAVGAVGIACLGLLVASLSATPSGRRRQAVPLVGQTSVKDKAPPLAVGTATLLADARQGHREGLGGAGSQHVVDGRRRGHSARRGAARARTGSGLSGSTASRLASGSGQASGSRAVAVVEGQIPEAGSGSGVGSGSGGIASGGGSGGAGSSGSAPPGPVGPGAPFGPGHLG